MIMRPDRSDRRRLAFLIESDGPGGAEQVVAHLAQHFAGLGDEVTVLVPAEGEGWLGRRLQGHHVAVEELPLGGPLSLTGIRALVRVLRRLRPDLLHTHEFGQALPGAMAARLTGVPHVLTLHGGDYFAGKLRRRLALRAAVALSGGITAVSHPLAARIAEVLRRPRTAVQMLPNGARPAPGHGNGNASRTALPARARFALAVGNLYPVKGHRYLLEALALLRDRRPDLHVAIAGRGAEEASLAALARARGIADRLHFLGLRDDVGALLRAADLFVHPSLSEGLPLAVLEAMLAERPIVATAVGEVPVVLAEGAAGTLVPPADPVALAEAIDQLLGDPQAARMMALTAGRRARAEYLVARMAERYDALYTGLLAVSP